jgi:hypothetical protein
MRARVSNADYREGAKDAKGKVTVFSSAKNHGNAAEASISSLNISCLLG